MLKLLKLLMLAALWLTSVLAAEAADPRRQLDVKVWPEGTVVFVKPTKMSRTTKSVAVKDLEYDIALNTEVDTVMINCSVVTSVVVPLDSVSIGGMGPYIVEKIYSEPINKGRWLSRLGIGISFADFLSIVQSEEAPMIRFHDIEFQHSVKKWRDCTQVYALAIEIIKQNKKN